jgi:hypothetical protein
METDKKNNEKKERVKRSYNRGKLCKEFTRNEIASAFRYFEENQKISRPFNMEPLQKLGKKDLLVYIKPEWCTSFAVWIFQKREEKKKKYLEATKEQQDMAKNIQQYSKAQVVQILKSLKDVEIPNKQSMKLDDLSFEIALHPKADEIMNTIVKNAKQKVEKEDSDEEEEEPSDQDNAITKSKKKSKKRSHKKSRSPSPSSSSSPSSSESEDNSEDNNDSDSEKSSSDREKQYKLIKKSKKSHH